MRGPIRHRWDLGHIAGENTGEVTAEDLDPEAGPPERRGAWAIDVTASAPSVPGWRQPMLHSRGPWARGDHMVDPVQATPRAQDAAQLGYLVCMKLLLPMRPTDPSWRAERPSRHPRWAPTLTREALMG